MSSSGWDEIIPNTTETSETVEAAQSNEPTTRGEDVEGMIETLRKAMQDVYHGNFDYSKADRMAALSLTLQIELAKFSADAEWRARQSKAEIKHISAEANYKYRTSSDKKISETALEQLVNKDPDVKNAELKMAEYERDARRWVNYLGTMRDSHIFFRNLGKV